MKYISLSFSILLAGCSSTINPFEDERISKSSMCQSHLKTLVKNDVFAEVKSLVDNECDIIIRRGWVKGKLSNKVKNRCVASYNYLAERKPLYKIGKEFIKSECYSENSNKFQWKSLAKNT